MEYADSILNRQKDSSLYATNKGYQMLKEKLAKYYSFANDGGWDSTAVSTGLKKGAKSPAVVALKKRLQLYGEIANADTTDVFSDSLSKTVQSFQKSFGLKADGIINDSTAAVLNVPVEERMQQIIVNMNRMLWMPPQTDVKRIEVNIPSQSLFVYADSGKAMEMPVIVGKEGNNTVMFTSEINKIVFNPTWNIPESIVKNEIMPKMKSDATYLKKNNIEIVSQNDSIPVLRQLPGKTNPLGKVKFLFPNTHDIYLHDTPDKSAFKQADRTLSHGCIRVADASRLAQYLLQDQQDWDKQKISAAMNSSKEQTVDLKTKHVVTINYLTAWVDDAGNLNFRPDVYNHDIEAAARMFTARS